MAVFVPNSSCVACTPLIQLDTTSSTGATASRPIELWSNVEPHGFEMKICNRGNCTFYVFLRRNGLEFVHSWTISAIVDPSGNVVATAHPFREEFQVPPGQEAIFPVRDQVVTHIGVLCVPTRETICPFCEVDIVLELSCGEKILYYIQPPIPIDAENNPVTISGVVECNTRAGATTTLTPSAYSAQLVICPVTFAQEAKIIATVPLRAVQGSTTSAMFEFSNVRHRNLSCFRVDIRCLATGNIIGSAPCQPALSGSSRSISVNSPIVINCSSTTCSPRLVSITGNIACTGGTSTNIQAQLVSCGIGTATCVGATGSSGTGSCSTATGVVVATSSVSTGGTGATGTYRFDDVAEGCYQIQFACTGATTTLFSTVVPCRLYCTTGSSSVITATGITLTCACS